MMAAPVHSQYALISDYKRKEGLLGEAIYKLLNEDPSSCRRACLDILRSHPLNTYWRAKTHVLLASIEILHTDATAQLQIAIGFL